MKKIVDKLVNGYVHTLDFFIFQPIEMISKGEVDTFYMSFDEFFKKEDGL